MKKELSGVPARVCPVVSPAAEAAGCRVWDIEFVKEGADRILRITIDTDKEGGVSMNDCVSVHREADRLLDEADPIEGSYLLQVTSPGIERRLTMPWHLKECAGSDVSVKLFSPLAGSRKLKGRLLGYEEGDGEAEGRVLLESDGAEIRLPLSSVSSVTLIYDFDTDPAFE